MNPRTRVIAILFITGVSYQCAPADYEDEDTDPDTWARVASYRPACILPAVPTDSSWLEWPLPAVTGAVRLPGGFRAIEAQNPKERGALAGLVATRGQDSVVLWIATDPGGGLATGGGIQADQLGSCSMQVGGRAAPAMRLRMIGRTIGDTTYFGFVYAAFQKGLAVNMEVIAKDSTSRDELLNIVANNLRIDTTQRR